MDKDEEIKIRVPAVMKRGVKAIAARRLTSESEITREALREYLERQGVELHEQAPPYKTSSLQAAEGKIVAAVQAEGQRLLKKAKKTKHT